MQFKLNAEDEVIDFIYIETDTETGLPVRDTDVLVFNSLSSSPSVVEITDLEYNPEQGSIWNGKDFIDPENREPRPLAKKDDGFRKFAFIVDNEYKFFYGVADTPENGMKIAILSSNPQVTIGEEI
jgi:hypothetical protein